MDNFTKRKQDILSKKDKSSKGGCDERIDGLCKKINNLDNYYTTSSCSGRIAFVKDCEKKGKGVLIRAYHDKISLKELKRGLGKIKNKRTIKFKQEPCILHIACRSLKDAQNLLDKAKLAGWKKSGIIGSNKRFVCELSGTDKLEFPIITNGKLLVDDDFLKLIVKKSNENLKKGWEKIERLRKLE